MTSLPVWGSQILTVPSLLADARRLPSGLHETDVTESVCPRRLRTSLPVVASEILTVRSLFAEARRVPLGHQATENTVEDVALVVLLTQMGSPVAASQTPTNPR